MRTACSLARGFGRQRGPQRKNSRLSRQWRGPDPARDGIPIRQNGIQRRLDEPPMHCGTRIFAPWYARRYTSERYPPPSNSASLRT
jgi:hypothetical protein